MIFQFINFRSGVGFPVLCPDPVLSEMRKKSNHKCDVLCSPTSPSLYSGMHVPQTKEYCT
jgi:hypothetical protein